MTANPWPEERVVVVSDDPPSVEAAVTQLEAWGAQPAVMFERSRALAALSVREPDLVVLDFGREPASASGVLLGLEELQPVLPGAVHPAPVVALAEGALGERLERDAWAPLHVAPHDDPVLVREALLAALEDTVASPGPAVGAVAAPAAAASAAAPAARSWLVSPVVAAAAVVALAGIGLVSFVALRGGSQQSPAAATMTAAPTLMPATALASAPPTVATTAPAAAPTAAPTTAPTAVPPTTPPVLPTAAPAIVPTAALAIEPTVAPTSAPAADVSRPEPTAVPRLPVTGNR